MGKQTKKWHKYWWGKIIIALIILILSSIVAFGMYVLHLAKLINEGKISNTNTSIYDPQIQKIRQIAENPNNFWLGSDNPKITIVEFSDFSCPYCKKSHPIIRKILKKHKDSVKLIFRDLPLQKNSELLSLAGRCAGEQKKFWLMHDSLFNEQSSSLSINDVSNFAKKINLNITKFEKCIQSKKYLPLIKKDINDAIALGVKGTPSWIINGYKIEGVINEATWENIIKKILNKPTLNQNAK